MMRKYHVRFSGEGAAATPPPYPVVVEDHARPLVTVQSGHKWEGPYNGASARGLHWFAFFLADWGTKSGPEMVAGWRPLVVVWRKCLPLRSLAMAMKIATGGRKRSIGIVETGMVAIKMTTHIPKPRPGEFHKLSSLSLHASFIGA